MLKPSFFLEILSFFLSENLVFSGGNSSTDLGFDEPPLPARRTGTLSSSDTSRTRMLMTDQEEEDEEETYVNIQYFLQQRRNTGDSESPNTMITMYQSEDEIDVDEAIEARPKLKRQVTDELPATPNVPSVSNDYHVMYKCILQSILDSEAIYLEALSVMLQYMKAMKVTLSTDQPFIPKEDFEVIFYR